MAQLLRLKLQGVRSVGDGKDESHVITFLNPLTIINGPNGTGKTTIIEALNYITTGMLPGGKLNVFIHSPEVARKNRVDAAVALEFIDAKKHKCTAVKRMVATVAKGKVAAKSEEFTLKVTFSDGREQAISAKVSDLQRAMVQHLGVPPAILSNVVFCHQEESCWPLSEPKELKSRFDKIFQLTKFVKAQDYMKTVKKDYEKESEKAELERRHAESNVKRKLELQRRQAQCKKELGEMTEKRKLLEEQLNFNRNRLRILGEEVQQQITAAQNFRVKNLEIANLKQQMGYLRVPDYSGTEEQLQQEIEQWESSNDRNAAMVAEKAKIQKELNETREKVETLADERRIIQEQLNELERLKVLRKDLVGIEANVRKMFSIDAGVKISAPDLLRADNAEKNAKYQEQLSRTMKRLAEAQDRVEDVQKTVTTIEVNITRYDEDEMKLKRCIGQLEAGLRSIEDSSASMTRLTLEMEAVEKNLAALPDVEEGRAEDVISERNSAQKRLDELTEECKALEKYADAEKELSAKEQQLSNTQTQLDELNEKHAGNWDTLYGGPPKASATWTDVITDVSGEIRCSLEDVVASLKAAQMKSQHVETMLQQSSSTTTKLNTQILAIQGTIWEMCQCDATHVEQRLKEVRAELKKARKELAPVEAKTVLYDSWLEETSASSCCPLCERKFHSKNLATDFVAKLRDMTLNIPEERESLTLKVMKREEQEKQLASAAVHAQQLLKIREELEENGKKQSKLESEAKTMLLEVRELQQEHDELAEKQRIAQHVQSDASLVDSFNLSVKKLKDDVGALRRQCRGQPGNTTLELAKSRREEQEAILRVLIDEGEQLQVMSSRRNTLRNKLNELRERRVTLGENAAQAVHRRKELDAKNAELREAVKNQREAREQLPQAKRSLQNAIKDRDVAKNQREKIESPEAQISFQFAMIERYEEIAMKLRTHADLDSEVTKNEVLAARTEEETMTCLRQIAVLEARSQNCVAVQTKKRELEDQLTLMRLGVKLRLEMEELEKLRPLAEDRNTRQQLDACNAAKMSAEVELGRIHGIVGGVARRLDETTKELMKKDLVGAENDYRSTTIEFNVLREAIADIVKYSACLDMSLIKFHTEKMTAINEIIDDLWRKVYKGMDIETIRIRSKSADSEVKNKAYDYTVVMVVEGGVEVEMRGRCSAGQKMLASLLIRIALADVFGGLCSIIALDEPTTNLDTLKVEHMAEMLNELIAARRNDDYEGSPRGRQFQMIVITHDERLVDKLTLGSRPEYIYVLGKNQRGLSYIRRQFPDGPSEPYLYEYQHVELNISEHTLNQDVYPLWTYSYLLALVPVFVLTDVLLYKPVILLEAMSYIVVWSIFVSCSSVLSQQVVEVFYGWATATEIGYFSYIYVQVPKSQFKAVTSYTRAALLVGRSAGYGVGQVIIATGVGSYDTLNVISLCSLCIALLVGLLLPSVGWRDAFRKQLEARHVDSEAEAKIATATYKEYVTTHFAAIVGDFRQMYTDTFVLKWSLWWALANCAMFQVLNYTQTLWGTITTDSDKFNGITEALCPFFGIPVVLLTQKVTIDWVRWGEVFLAVGSLIQGLLLLLLAKTNALFLMYAGYIVYSAIFQAISTIAQGNMATRLKSDSFGLLFGLNTFVALVLQSLLTVGVIDIANLSIRPQYLVYFGYHIAVALLFLVPVAYNFVSWISTRRKRGSKSQKTYM